MSSYWLTDPELFLYAKGTGPDDVLLRRCKKMVISSSSSSSLVVPMKPDDFEYVETVKNHLELIANMFTWDEPDYKRLVKYIYEKRLLVNSQGFVIAELLHKAAEKDGKKTTKDANKEEEVPAIIYIRSLDVLPLKPYIPKLTERPIPLRTVKYLGDVNGKAAMMEEDYSVTKLTERVVDLESKNNTLETNVTKLTARVANLDAENTMLESKNNTLDTNIMKLTADMVAQTADLESKNKNLEDKVTKLKADQTTQMTALATLQSGLNRVLADKANYKEVWMNDLTNSEWVGIEGLRGGETRDDLTIVGHQGTFTVDDSSSHTNVRARYWYKIMLNIYECKAVCLEDLAPNKEKARFSQTWWFTFKSQGKMYVYRRTDETPT